MNDLAVLMHSALLTGEEVFLFTDDIADYFNQFRVAPEDQWLNVAATLTQQGDSHYDPARPSIAFVNDRMLGFGHVRASNHAQRHSNFMMEVLQRRALVRDRQISGARPEAAFHAWLSRRRALGERTGEPEDRRFFHMMYTDDALFAAVGVDETLNLLHSWWSLSR